MNLLIIYNRRFVSLHTDNLKSYQKMWFREDYFRTIVWVVLGGETGLNSYQKVLMIFVPLNFSDWFQTRCIKIYGVNIFCKMCTILIFRNLTFYRWYEKIKQLTRKIAWFCCELVWRLNLKKYLLIFIRFVILVLETRRMNNC